jgi:hypothetical protein
LEGVDDMIDVEANIRTDERGFLYLEYLGKRLMTFRGEQKMILRQLIEKVEDAVAQEGQS